MNLLAQSVGNTSTHWFAIGIVMSILTPLFFLLAIIFTIFYSVQLRKNNTQQSLNGLRWGIGIMIVITLCCAGTLIAAVINKNTDGYNSGEFHFTHRSASDSDITVSESQLNLENLGEDIIFTANNDIEGLTISVYFYDSEAILIKSINRSFGNVKKGNQYSISYSLLDFNISEWRKIKTYSVKVTDGIYRYI